MNAITATPIGTRRVGIVDRPASVAKQSTLTPALLVILGAVAAAGAYALSHGGIALFG